MTTLFNLRAVREEFPALDQQVHGQRLAYLDNAATTQRPRAVLEAVRQSMEEDNANVHRGVHALSQRATDAFDEARGTVRRFINARRDEEVIFTKGCTEAINLVANSWGRSHLRPGDTVLLATMEHHANIVPWQLAAKATGARVEAVPVSDEVVLDLGWLEDRLQRGDVRMVGVKHVCNATGTVNPVAEIARLASAHGALTLIDGAQGLAHEPVDVQALGIDFYAMSAHKVYGPMGVGALYGRYDLLEAMPPWQGGGDMIRSVSFDETTFNGLPNKFEPGTPNVPGVVGFAAALEWVSKIGLGTVRDHEEHVRHAATQRLEAVPGLTLIGTAPGKAGVLSFKMEQAHPHDIGTILDLHGVAVRTGHHCCMPLMTRLNVPATTRASLAAYSGEDDIDQLMEGLEHVLKVFK